jgi:hypothetical protein
LIIKPMNLSFYIAFFMSIILFFVIAYLSSDARIQDEYVEVKLSTNETVWDLAEEYSEQHSLTPSDFVVWVEENNHIDPNHVRAGVSITIPVIKEKQQDSLMLVAHGGSTK